MGDFLLCDQPFPGKDQPVVALITAAAASIPLGFGISTISVAILSLRGSYDANVKEFDGVWAVIRMPGKPDRKQMLYAVATFDHEVIAKPIHEWLARRWNSFFCCR
jgi:hypothetical protein